MKRTSVEVQCHRFGVRTRCCWHSSTSRKLDKLPPTSCAATTRTADFSTLKHTNGNASIGHIIKMKSIVWISENWRNTRGVKTLVLQEVNQFKSRLKWTEMLIRSDWIGPKTTSVVTLLQIDAHMFARTFLCLHENICTCTRMVFRVFSAKHIKQRCKHWIRLHWCRRFPGCIR